MAKRQAEASASSSAVQVEAEKVSSQEGSSRNTRKKVRRLGVDRRQISRKMSRLCADSYSVSSRTRAKTQQKWLLENGLCRGRKRRPKQKQLVMRTACYRSALDNPYATPSTSGEASPSFRSSPGLRAPSSFALVQRTPRGKRSLRRHRNSGGGRSVLNILCRSSNCGRGSVGDTGEKDKDERGEDNDDDVSSGSGSDVAVESGEDGDESDHDGKGQGGDSGDAVERGGSKGKRRRSKEQEQGSSGQPRASDVPGPSSSTSQLKIGSKRRSSGSTSGDKDVSCPKKCHSATSSGRSLQLDSEHGHSSQSTPSRPVRCPSPSQGNFTPALQQWLDTFKLWSNAERAMALDDLIAHCELPQVRHMMDILEPHFQRDFISLLPKELALYVLSFLKPQDLLKAAQTCRYWHVLCADNLLWREKCLEEGIDENLVFGARVLRPATSQSHYKGLFMRQFGIENQWRKDAIRPPMMLKAHDDHVITCLEFCGQRIVSGSDDNTLKVWSAITGKCLRTLVGHTGGVWSSQMSGNIVISGSTDRTLRIWNTESGVCKHVLHGHTSTVRCMSLNDKKVVSGSRDATMRIWDIDTGQCLHVLQGHMAAVRCVQYDGKRVVSGAYDYTVRVWNPETETCLHVLQGHTNRVYSLQFDGVHIVSGSLDTSIRVWRVDTGACLHTLVGHQSLTSGLELKDNLLVSGNADSTVKVWDVTTGQCLQTLQGPNKHQSAVTCLQFNKKFVVSSSDDGTVKIWDLHTGEFLRNLVTLPSGGSGGVVWRLRCSNTKLVCAVGSRNGTEETKLLVLDFDVEEKKTS